MYKSLDRPIEIFGLKGKWCRIFLVAAFAGVVLSLLFGNFLGDGMNIGLCIFSIIVSFLGCFLAQMKISEREIDRIISTPDVLCSVQKRETLSRILRNTGDE